MACPHQRPHPAPPQSRLQGLSDEALAQRIRDDGIDILVDVAGHTAGNRLQVFARKPAPVSLHWLDFGYTTGLSAIDYYLTDWPTVPQGSEALFSETPWRLDGPGLVYRPAEGMGEVSPLPAEKKGHLTFGSLTRAVRINHHTVRVWAELLKQFRRTPGHQQRRLPHRCDARILGRALCPAWH
ncbi:MAG: hypothetical protein IPO19_14165 [Rhodoferax sp.]|nr:hypothetical protein [Rhodoferax sp.]